MQTALFCIIYAHRGWTYRCWSTRGEGRSAVHHRAIVKIAEIKTLPVSEIADDNVVLFLAVTFPLLPEALEVITAWGCTYKTSAFTGVKRSRESNGWFWGVGYYTRSNPELCVVATRGNGLARQCSLQLVYCKPPAPCDTPVTVDPKCGSLTFGGIAPYPGCRLFTFAAMVVALLGIFTSHGWEIIYSVTFFERIIS
jgi:hypothetical protein